MRPEEAFYHFPWLPPGWKFLKAEWQDESLISLQPCPAQATNQQPNSQTWREQILKDVLTGKKPGTAIQVPDQGKSEWATKTLLAMRAIPFGTTITYKELATLAGNPLAARAAARICAGNRVCLVIPCHRIVPGSGGPGGFFWGHSLKEKMILWEKEKAEPHSITPV